MAVEILILSQMQTCECLCAYGCGQGEEEIMVFMSQEPW